MISGTSRRIRQPHSRRGRVKMRSYETSYNDQNAERFYVSFGTYIR